MSDVANNDIGSTAPGHYGADSTGLVLSEARIGAAWNVQGDPAQAPFVASVQRLFEMPLPLAPNAMTHGNALIALWLGPRSWLLVETTASGRPSALTDFGAKRDALNALGGALFEVSASRVAYRISGAHAATVLAKSCPLDFGKEAFPAGACAQSVFGHVNALFYRHDEAPMFLMLVGRSFARDVWRTLCRSSAQYGYDIAEPQPIAGPR